MESRDYTKEIERFLDGDKEAFTIIYNRSWKYFYKCIYLKTSNDNLTREVLQESYLKIYMKMDTLNDRNTFLTWGKNICLHTASDLKDKEKKWKYMVPITETTRDQDEDETDLAYENLKGKDKKILTPEDHLDKSENDELLKEILDELTDVQRYCIVEQYWEGKKMSEIAEELGIPENTVKTHVSRGKKKIKEQVLEMEKRGIKLYGLAPLPFFLWLVEGFELYGGPEWSEEMIRHEISEVMKAAENIQTVGTVHADPSSGKPHNQIKQIGTDILKTTSGKVIAGVLAAAVIGGAVWMNRPKEEPVEPEVVTEEPVETPEEPVEEPEPEIDNSNIYGITLDMVSGTELAPLEQDLRGDGTYLVCKNEEDDLWLYQMRCPEGTKYAGERIAVFRKGKQLFFMPRVYEQIASIPIVADYLKDYPELHLSDLDGDGDQEVLFLMKNGQGAHYEDGHWGDVTWEIWNYEAPVTDPNTSETLYPIMDNIFVMDGDDFGKDKVDGWYIDTHVFSSDEYTTDFLSSGIDYSVFSQEQQEQEQEQGIFSFNLGGRTYQESYPTNGKTEWMDRTVVWTSELGEKYGQFSITWENDRLYIKAPFALREVTNIYDASNDNNGIVGIGWAKSEVRFIPGNDDPLIEKYPDLTYEMIK